MESFALKVPAKRESREYREYQSIFRSSAANGFTSLFGGVLVSQGFDWVWLAD
ncbi:MAG: hypothetical protein ACJAT6_000095 [Akkermansiaceae bacterium]|jgi:hypothetical protein